MAGLTVYIMLCVVYSQLFGFWLLRKRKLLDHRRVFVFVHQL